MLILQGSKFQKLNQYTKVQEKHELLSNPVFNLRYE